MPDIIQLARISFFYYLIRHNHKDFLAADRHGFHIFHCKRQQVYHQVNAAVKQV